MQQRQLLHCGLVGSTVGKAHDDGEDHGGSTHHGSTNQHGFGRCLEGIARAIVLFQKMLGGFEVRVNSVVALEFLFDIGNLFNQGQLVHALGVVSHRAVRIHRNGDRAHSQKPEGYKAEGKYCRSHHQGFQPHVCHQVSNRHKAGDAKAQPKAREVSSHQTRKNVQRSAAFTAGIDHFPYMR